ncbi:DUF3105 domain-containing protein [Streptomyces sp. NBC_00160]|uniref:DUF3105 domain-containing protein n=1 Tax=Streptomyces sp. NBC_00160 TaxID=2903628 RepID=UPI0022504A7A|nr:DUF3105 domain-containing protein [Streptomyces sp. NBC_00160]MCX5302719.1 DUF3105 domain-containing protein [Streptomyces sp. NBC_00160]
MHSKNPKDTPPGRRARIEEMRRSEQARERRSKIIKLVVSLVVLVVVLGAGWYLVASTNENEKAKAALVAGEKTWSDLSRNHVTKDVTYPMAPAAGGDHNPVWQNCNGEVYQQPVAEENAVHSMEHGAVWVTYSDKAAAGDVKALGARVSKTPYPYPGQSSPITLTAWGHQLNVNEASDARVTEFLDKYVQGPQTPEPGAACTGGKSA